MAKLSDKGKIVQAEHFNSRCGLMGKLLAELFVSARKASGMNQKQVADAMNLGWESERSWTAVMVSEVERGHGWEGSEILDLFNCIGLDFFKVLEGTQRIAIGHPGLVVE